IDDRHLRAETVAGIERHALENRMIGTGDLDASRILEGAVVDVRDHPAALGLLGHALGRIAAEAIGRDEGALLGLAQLVPLLARYLSARLQLLAIGLLLLV